MSASVKSRHNPGSESFTLRSQMRPTVFSALVLSLLATASVLSRPADAKPTQPTSFTLQERLDKMFSPTIREMANACLKQGGVNLAAGVDRDGSVICANGWRKSPVQYNAYLSLATDLETAAFLVGVVSGAKSDPEYKPEFLATFLTSPQGKDSFRKLLQNALTRSKAVPKQSSQSVKVLTNKIIQRSLPFLQKPAKLDKLFGTSDEYTAIADNFCTAPGMSIAQAKKLTPALDTVQMYAVCLQEAGLEVEVAKGKNQQAGRKL